jgi:hypothetical protein
MRPSTLPAAARGARRTSRNWLTANFNPVHPRASAGSVPAPSHQVGEANLGHPAQVGIVYPSAVGGFDDVFDVEFLPADVNHFDFRYYPVGRKTGRFITDQPRAVGQLQNRMEEMKPTDPCTPSEGSHGTAELGR